MGLLEGLLGKNSEMEPAEAQSALGMVLGEDEHVVLAYRLIRDMLVLTDRRLLAVNKQGITGKKVSYLSIPFQSISTFAIQTAGHLDLDAELVLWVRGREEPFQWDFSTAVNIYKLQALLTAMVARKVA